MGVSVPKVYYINTPACLYVCVSSVCHPSAHQPYPHLLHTRQNIPTTHDTAIRILEYGLAQHPDFLSQAEYVLALLDLLLQLHDDQRYRGLCDR